MIDRLILLLMGHALADFGLQSDSMAHCAIDFGKCDNHYGIHEDQAMHVACKILWAIL